MMSKQTNISLNENQDLFRVLFESAIEGIVVVNSEGKIDMVNDSLLRLYGYATDELLGNKIELLIPNRFHQSHMSKREAYYKAPKKRSMGLELEMLGRKKDGTEFPVDVSLNYFDINSKMYVVAFVSDITRSKKAENALKAEKEKASLYLDISASFFIAIDKRQKVTKINKKGCEILGYAENEIIGKNWFDTFLPIEEQSRVKEVFVQMQQGKIKPVEFFENRIVTKSGEIRLMEWHNTIIYDGKGNPRETLSSGIDITDIRKMEIAQMDALHQGQEKERKRLATELHDGIVQTLSAISLNLKVLEDAVVEMPENEQKSYKKAMFFLEECIADTRNISHALMPATLEHFGLVKAVQSICDNLSTDSLTFDLSAKGDFAKLEEKVEVSLFRIIQELINNIIKHAKASVVEIQLTKSKNGVTLEVEDNGIGFQGNIEQMQSNGLGLRNLFSRVKSMNGILKLDSSHLNGTTINVEIPIK